MVPFDSTDIPDQPDAAMPAGGAPSLVSGFDPSNPTAAAQAPVAPVAHGTNWIHGLTAALPAVLATVVRSKFGPLAGAGLLQGYTQTLEQQRLTKQHENEILNKQQEDRTGKLTTFVHDAVSTLGQNFADDPAGWAGAAKLYDDTAQRVFGTPAGFISRQIAFPAVKGQKMMQAEAAKVITSLQNRYGDQFPDLLASGAVIPFGADNKPTTIKSIMALAGMDVTDASGQSIAAQPSSKPVTEGEYIDRIVREKQKAAGKPLTGDEYQAVVLDARKQWNDQGAPKSLTSVQGMLDGKPFFANHTPEGKFTDPKTGADISGKFEPNPSASAATLDLPEIAVGSKEYKVAQDLAFGRLRFQDFGKLVAYGRNVGLKLALYSKAAELNPNFNSAAFEMGYQLAASPKVQQQMASLDNVQQGIPDLLKFSDAAARTGIPLINQYSNPAGIKLGSKTYSNFQTARIAFADELSGALGYGSATDMSREMGFNMTDPSMSPAVFASNVKDVLIPFVERKRATLLNQMGVYGQPGMNPAASPDTQASPSAPKKINVGDVVTVKINGTPTQVIVDAVNPGDGTFKWHVKGGS